MIDYYTLCQLQYILIIFIYLYEKLTLKYITNKDIILNDLHVYKYDKKHSLYILYIILDIQIYTISTDNHRIIYIYYKNEKLSTLCINNEKPKNDINKIILSLYYLDKYHIINLLDVYNCGVIIHTTKLFKHIYNYMGIKREIFNLLV
jgi:hypothetical protein